MNVNDFSMKTKIILLISAAVLVFILFLLYTFAVLRNETATPQQRSITPQPSVRVTLYPTSTDRTTTPLPLTLPTTQVQQIFDDHHNNALPTGAPLKAFNLLETTQRDVNSLKPIEIYSFTADASGKKYTPDRNYSAQLLDGTLVVRSQVFQTSTQFVPIEATTEAVNFVWITNNLLLLVEKESASRKIDRIYLYEKDTSEKTFIIGSFPVVSRFNPAISPTVYSNGKDIVFTDNEGRLWRLNIVF